MRSSVRVSAIHRHLYPAGKCKRAVALACVRVSLCACVFVFARTRMRLFSLVSGLKRSHTSSLLSYRYELGSRHSTEPGFEVRRKTSSEFQPNFLVSDIFSKLGIFWGQNRCMIDKNAY